MRATRGASSTTAGRRPQARNQPAVYEDFTPLIENMQDGSSHVVLIHLPGFTKEQLRIIAESTRRILRVRGERLVSGNKWNRFQEEIPVPQDCQITEIRAKFERGILHITMPRRMPATAPVPADDHPLPTPQPAHPAAASPPEPEHVSPPPRISSPQQQQPAPPFLPPLRLPSPPSPPPVKMPEPVLPPPQLRADDHEPADISHEKQPVHEETKTSPPRIVLRPTPAAGEQQQGPPTTFGSVDQEDHHIAQPQTPPSRDRPNNLQPQLKKQPLTDSHEEMTSRRRRGHAVENEGFDEAQAPRMKQNEDSTSAMLYGNGWKRKLLEERQLAINAGVAILVAFSLGAYVSYSLLSPHGKSNN